MKAQHAIKEAAAAAIAEHWRNGRPVYVWRDEQVVALYPDGTSAPVHRKQEDQKAREVHLRPVLAGASAGLRSSKEHPMTKALFLGAAILAGVAMGAAAQETAPVKDVKDLKAEYAALIASERAFAKKSADTNSKEAFLAFIAEDGVMFEPDPVPGREHLQKQPTPDYVLKWWPTHADIARSADLGWTTGPFELSTPGRKGATYGYFSTVWRKQDDGTWRFVADLGALMPNAPPKGGEPGPLDPEKLDTVPPVDMKETEASLLDTDRLLGETAGKGVEPAYMPVLADDVRLMRQGHAPFLGKDAAALRLAEEKGTFSSQPIKGGVSAAGDLGYVYGSYQRKGEGAEAGSYLRVWERHPESGWRLALEVLKPRPAQP